MNMLMRNKYAGGLSAGAELPSIAGTTLTPVAGKNGIIAGSPLDVFDAEYWSWIWGKETGEDKNPGENEKTKDEKVEEGQSYTYLFVMIGLIATLYFLSKRR